MGTIKDRNGMDLTEAEDIKRKQEYTEKLYKKDQSWVFFERNDAKAETPVLWQPQVKS